MPRPAPGLFTLVAFGPLWSALAGGVHAAEKTKVVGRADLATTLCGTCHKVAAPDVLPRSAWRGEFRKMALIAAGKEPGGWGEAPPAIELLPDWESLLAYYESKAPNELPAPALWPAPSELPLRFVRRSIPFPGALTSEPAISNVQLVDLLDDARPELLATDMRQGGVLLARPYEAQATATLLAGVPNPAHVTAVDLDADGRKDLLVADLGEFFPGDHEHGAVVVLLRNSDTSYTPVRVEGFPRVADVEAGDFDGDGQPELLVAGFGWRKQGGIWRLRNRAAAGRLPDYERFRIDSRPGTIHVIPTQLDGDGKLDFVALIAQEHESVVAFLGDGQGGFTPKTLYQAPHPNWGSSGLALADLDQDGDQDLLMTNGDMFDDRLLKPYHGIQWLENKGGLKFEARLLAILPGVHRAVAVDLDGDGDQDVVATNLTAGSVGGAELKLGSLVWLEQTKRGKFAQHTLEMGNPVHATLDVGDVDGDGDIDIVTGSFEVAGSSERFLDVWENQGPGRR